MEVFGGVESEQEQSQPHQDRQDHNREREEDRERYLEPALSIPSRHYSLDPDCIGGWKPKRPKPKNRPNNVFPLRYEQQPVDDIIRELSKNGDKYDEALIYVGPRRNNSQVLHSNRPYPSPYDSTQWEGGQCGQRTVREGLLQFSSDFESGNLDAVVQKSSSEFQLYMRVDSNTRGHTNWFYFEVRNRQFIGSITFAICNFRRAVSLYQRGLRPYVRSSLKKEEWRQQGHDLSYRRHRPPYKSSLPPEAPAPSLYALTFTYKFELPHDAVRFAYAPPYPYSHLLRFLTTLPNHQRLPPLKTLSGLPIPVLRIGSEDGRAVLVTARVHPGEASSSFVAQGLLQALCADDAIGRELRGKYVFYVVPMLNPDGVVAGNYRTSLFGKDLNRTFDQSRRFAFPEVFQLLRLAEEVRRRHQKRFCLFLDLHGHSIKKNAFMYGPDYALQDSNYDLCRELPRLLAALTPYFRYYSCTFRIPDAKASTARAVLNRIHNVPFAYTLETSNGCYFDALSHQETAFTTAHWNELGGCLAKALLALRLERLPRIVRAHTLKIKKQLQILEDAPAEPVSDDDIREDDSDIEPLTEDLPDHELELIELAVRGRHPQGQQEQGQGQISVVLKEPSSAKKVKPPRLEELTKRPKVVNESAVEGGRQGSFHLPERKNISFPAVFPQLRADIFASRHSRHDRYEKPMQLRLRRHETQGRRDSSKESSPAKEGRRQEGGREDKRQEGVQLQDLIKKYKFNF